MKRLIAIILTFTFLLVFSIVMPAYAFGESPKTTVRVGWFASDGVHTISPDGTRSGYDYDYLQAISQYTDWEYEFVEGTWSECYNWLKNGDIDLLGIVNKTPEREQIFDYSYTSAGTEMCCLFVSVNDKRYSYQDFKEFDGMTIAIEEGTYQSTVLKEYAAQNNFSYTTITYPTLAEAQESVDNGTTDALLSSNTDVISGYKAIAQFNPIPFFYATTKGNTELLKELNHAMNELFTYYPKFGNDLYSRYYGDSSSADAVFTSLEQAYIENAPTVQVFYDFLWYPIEYYNEKEQRCEGILPDLLDLISKKSGIKFDYIAYPNSLDALQTMENLNDNTISSITYDYKWAAENNLNITQPFLDTSIMCVTKETRSNPKTVALVKVDYIGQMIGSLLADVKPIYFSSRSDCIEAVASGKADCTYLNNYEAEYYLTIPKYQSLNFHTSNLFRQKICLGVSKDADPLLFSIISKSLQSIPNSNIQNLIYTNSYHIAPVTLESFARANPLTAIFIVLSFIFIIIAGALIALTHKIKTARRITIENERYHQLAVMTEEHIYEYCYETDLLSFDNTTESFLSGIKSIPNYSASITEYLRIGAALDNTLYSCFMDKMDITKEIYSDYFCGQPCWYRITSKIIRDNNNQAVYAIGKIQNVQSEHEEKEHLIDCANRDGMTGLYNGKAFRKRIEDLLSDGNTLIIIDIDHFKDINDQFGHYNGDIVLTSVAKILNEIFDPPSLVSRLGGDEFAVFIQIPQTKEQIEAFCTELLEKVSDIYIEPDAPMVTLSIGVASSLPNDTYPQLYKRSDALLYETKRNGRNGYLIE